MNDEIVFGAAWFACTWDYHGPVIVREQIVRALIHEPASGRGHTPIVSVEAWCIHGRWAIRSGLPDLVEVLDTPQCPWATLTALGVTVDRSRRTGGNHSHPAPIAMAGIGSARMSDKLNS